MVTSARASQFGTPNLITYKETGKKNNTRFIPLSYNSETDGNVILWTETKTRHIWVEASSLEKAIPLLCLQLLQSGYPNLPWAFFGKRALEEYCGNDVLKIVRRGKPILSEVNEFLDINFGQAIGGKLYVPDDFIRWKEEEDLIFSFEGEPDKEFISVLRPDIADWCDNNIGHGSYSFDRIRYRAHLDEHSHYHFNFSDPADCDAFAYQWCRDCSLEAGVRTRTLVNDAPAPTC
jgi:hypothetical protein